jgi:hypothetical protein
MIISNIIFTLIDSNYQHSTMTFNKLESHYKYRGFNVITVESVLTLWSQCHYCGEIVVTTDLLLITWNIFLHWELLLAPLIYCWHGGASVDSVETVLALPVITRNFILIHWQCWGVFFFFWCRVIFWHCGFILDSVESVLTQFGFVVDT